MQISKRIEKKVGAFLPRLSLSPSLPNILYRRIYYLSGSFLVHLCIECTYVGWSACMQTDQLTVVVNVKHFIEL